MDKEIEVFFVFLFLFSLLNLSLKILTELLDHSMADTPNSGTDELKPFALERIVSCTSQLFYFGFLTGHTFNLTDFHRGRIQRYEGCLSKVYFNFRKIFVSLKLFSLHFSKQKE